MHITRSFLPPSKFVPLLQNKAAILRNMKDRHLSVTAALTPYFPVSEAAGMEKCAIF